MPSALFRRHRAGQRPHSLQTPAIAGFCGAFFVDPTQAFQCAPQATHPRLWREMSEPAISVGGPDGGGSNLPQLLIEIPAPASIVVGIALAFLFVCQAIRIVLPVLSDKAAQRLALVRGHRTTHKRK